MFSAILACTICGTAPVESVPSDIAAYSYQYRAELTESERERLWQEIHFAIKKMNYYLDEADREASKIKDVDIRSTTKAVIQGCICGLASKNCYAIAVAGCLNGLADIAGNSYDHFVRAKDYVYDAERYAEIADELQERLWRD